MAAVNEGSAAEAAAKILTVTLRSFDTTTTQASEQISDGHRSYVKLDAGGMYD